MQVGDRVRFTTQQGEGIVTALLPGGMVEVAIDNDFRIPYRASDLVPVAREERVVFGKPKVEAAADRTQKIADVNTVKAEHGLFMAMVPKADGSLELCLVNNTDYDLPFTVGTLRNEQYTGIDANVVAARSAKRYGNYQRSELLKWPVFVFQVLWHKPGTHTAQAKVPLVKQVNPDLEDLVKPKVRMPVLGVEAHIWPLDDHLINKPSAKVIQTAVHQKQGTVPVAKTTAPASAQSKVLLAVPEVVDLHIEKLVGNVSAMNADQILDAQLQHFESCLTKALAARMPKITFIHGVGTGVLKKLIHLKLKQHKQVKEYKEAPQSAFGKGATEVWFG